MDAGGEPMTITSNVKLAPDSALPYRDVLLEPAAMRERLGPALGIDMQAGLGELSVARVNYQVGKSLRTVYRADIGGTERTIAARMFGGAKSADVYLRCAPGAKAVAMLRGIAHDPEIGAVYWVFPNDRKIASLQAVLDPSMTVPGIGRVPVRKRLVAYAPEKSATFACEDSREVPIAYAKVAAAHQAERDYNTYSSLRAALDPDNPSLCLPAPLGYSSAQRTLWLEALPGRRMAESRGDDEIADLERLGAAVAAFHGLAMPDVPRFDRFAAEQLANDASIMRSGRPDAADAIDHLAARLTATAAATHVQACLHGDLHPKNAIIRSDRVALIDVEDAGLGATAADIASLLAALVYRRETGELSAAGCRARAEAFLVGYRSHRDLPRRESLAWHTAAALFVERAARAITRVRPLGLEHFPALLATSERLLDRGLEAV
jgi:aminoglycoside phosphotransferase (APT) family kinase protein